MKTFLLVLIIINVAQDFSKVTAVPCPKLVPAPVDEKFARGKFTLVGHSDTEAYREIDKSFEFIGKPNETKSFCLESFAVLEDGSEFTSKMRCEYEDISTQYCGLEKADQDNYFSTKSSITYTSSDNSTYIAGVCCVGDKGAFWWIATSGENKLDPAAQKAAFEIFEKAGLDPKKPANEDSPIHFKHFTNSDDAECK